jgi:3-oxoacyl-[acyl-carrier protein] reductase
MNMQAYPDGCSVLFGASGGLGQAIARRMAELGADQVLTYHDHAERLHAVCSDIKASGRGVESLECNVTDADVVRQVIHTAQKKYGRVHSVVSATGLNFTMKPLGDLDPEEFRRVIDVDVLGFFNIAKAAIRAMRDSGGGTITALGTYAIDRMQIADALSSVPKSAVALMVRHIAAEEGSRGIRANFVGPGVMDAGMAIAMKGGDPANQRIFEAFCQQVPLRRPGSAEELGEVVAFLASSRASYVTGQTIHCDGGLSA